MEFGREIFHIGHRYSNSTVHYKSMKRICFDRILPRDLNHFSSMTKDNLLTARLAAVISKQWVNGTTLRVAFMGGTPAQQELVKTHAVKWSLYANLKFDFGNDPAAEIRIAFNENDGAWSYMGTDCLEIPRDQPTMNLGWVEEGVIDHEFGHCLSGDTLIDCPRDLEKFPKGIPIRDLVGTTPWVYAWKDWRVVVRKASRVWLSKRSVATVRVKLRGGAGRRKNAKYLPPMELVGTADHPVRLSDGVTWKKLGDLVPGDRLCSMYRQRCEFRSTLTWTGSGVPIPEHSFICKEVYGHRPERHDCHHKNHRKSDHSVENLEWKHESDHTRDHHIGRKLSEAHKQKLISVNRDRVYTPEIRRNMSLAQLGKPTPSSETRSKMSIASKAHGISDEWRAKMLAGRAAFIANGGRSGMFGKKASEETRRKQSAAIGEWHAKRKAASVNHVVVSVEPWLVQDVYDMTVPDADNFFANGVNAHNSLGAIHEHQNPSGGINWNREQVYKDLGGSPNFWDRATVDSNMFDKYAVDQINGTAMDPKSIMMYSFPAEWTTDGFHTDENKVLSDQDKAFIASAKMYPKLDAPPEEDILPVSFITEKSAEINPPGEEDLYALNITEDGIYVIQTQGGIDAVMTLYGPDSKTALIAKDDDSGEGLNSLIARDLKVGKYWVSVRHYSKTEKGFYRISATKKEIV